uniref:R13L1/DRL21-like LRR repeat region domain-containing protein n=1 Tax=Oryza glumipatula TaxID=40148 RepID=A0A0E0AI17_9ORYZ
MASGLGQLTDLQTVTVFNIGDDLSHCSIGDLKNLCRLRGHIHITGLQNITAGDDAKEANLVDSSLGMLVSITIDDCQNCNEIPYLGDLPSLKYLFIQKMYVVESFGQRSNSLTTDGRCTESVGDILFAILEWNKQGGFPTASLSLSTNDTAAQVLQYLRPNSNLEELIMKGYNGSSFPSWNIRRNLMKYIPPPSELSYACMAEGDISIIEASCSYSR